jgi:hypothetical protein
MSDHFSLKQYWRFKVIFRAVVLGGLSLALWAFVIEPNRLVVHQVALPLPEWPTDRGPLRLAVISDLHVGSPYITLDKVQRLVEMINAEQPDVVLMAGDYVIQDVIGGHVIAPEVFAEKLKGLRAPGGVIAVLGNHDWWYNGQRVKSALEHVGIRVLENEAIAIEHHGHSIWFAGLADYWTRKPNIEQALSHVPLDAPVIVLTHNPDVFPQMPARVNLTIAGHTHGGQVNFPIIGRPIVPSTFGQRYAIGHVQEGGRHLFVTPGIGTSNLPVRFRVPPEISLVTISTPSPLD